MVLVNLENILATLELMIQLELTLADLYREAARVWDDEKDFWNNMAVAETKHANHISKMIGIIKKKPEKFSVVRPFNTMGVKTVMAGIEDHHNKLKAGKIPREKFLLVTRDIERSVLEKHYVEIVKTNDLEYMTLMTGILAETEEHRKSLEKRLGI